MDDVIILPALIALTVKLIPEEVWQKNKGAALGMWQDGKPKKWYYAFPIVFDMAVDLDERCRKNDIHLILVENRNIIKPKE